MLRAGREPAEDMKRRLVAACEEVGLEVDRAQMCLTRARDGRFIVVSASLNWWPHDAHMITLQTFVNLSGTAARVEIFCQAIGACHDPVGSFQSAPLMRGRKDVTVNQLVDDLQDTLLERAMVLRALARGEQPPFVFDDTVWDPPRPLV